MLQNEIWKLAPVAVMGAALLAYVFFPRYDWRTLENPGSISIVVYDRWTGRFQRAVWENGGNLNVMGVYTPF